MTPWDLILEILAAAGVAAEYCAREEIFSQFTEWVTNENVQPFLTREDIEKSHQILKQSPGVILALVKGMESELSNEELVEQFRAALSEL